MGPNEKQQARQYAEWALRLCSNSSGGVATALADARLDSTQAEATHLLGRFYLESGDLRRACELLLRALYFATQSDVLASLLTAEILEDLALAQLRSRFDAELLPDHVAVVPIETPPAAIESAPAAGGASTRGSSSAATEAVPALAESVLALVVKASSGSAPAGDGIEGTLIRNLMACPKGQAGEIEAIDAILLSALAIRRLKNGHNLVRLGHSLLRRAELFWATRRYEEVVNLLCEARSLFESAAGTSKCKAVAQLTSWVASSYLCAGQLSKAEGAIKRAEELATAVFGDVSWESYRLLRDKVRMWQALADSSKEAQSADAARKAYSKAERFDTRAIILQQALLKDGVADKVLVSLSHYAPWIRERLWQATGEAASVSKQPPCSTGPVEVGASDSKLPMGATTGRRLPVTSPSSPPLAISPTPKPTVKRSSIKGTSSGGGSPAGAVRRGAGRAARS